MYDCLKVTQSVLAELSYSVGRFIGLFKKEMQHDYKFGIHITNDTPPFLVTRTAQFTTAGANAFGIGFQSGSSNFSPFSKYRKVYRRGYALTPKAVAISNQPI